MPTEFMKRHPSECDENPMVSVFFKRRRCLPFGVISCALGILVVLSVVGCSSDTQAKKLSIEKGQAIYSESCEVCHGDAATGDQSISDAPNHGPDGHTWHHADGQLAGIILGELNYPGRTMPSFEGKLSERDVAAVLDFFKSNWSPDQRSTQSEVSKNWEELQGG